tara:strand:- start:2565 stop:3095 length:531 start_codon:yes stop_codon:yes gene_type:complete
MNDSSSVRRFKEFNERLIKSNVSIEKYYGIDDKNIKIILDKPYTLMKVNNHVTEVQKLVIYYYEDNNAWVLNKKISKYPLLDIKKYAVSYIKLTIHIYYKDYPFNPPEFKIYDIINTINKHQDNILKIKIGHIINNYNIYNHGDDWSPIMSIGPDLLCFLISYLELIEYFKTHNII